MSSFYAKYLIERTDDSIIETKSGFVTYRFINEKQCYIIDIYVAEHMRKFGVARKMADQVAQIAKDRGCTELLGTVNPSCKGAKESLKVLFAYGMDLQSCQPNIIICKKAI